MKLYFRESMEWIFPEEISQIRDGINQPSFDCPKGGMVSVVLIINELNQIQNVTLSSASDSVLFRKMVDICVNRNTAETNFASMSDDTISKTIVRKAPYRVYDALAPIPSGKLSVENGAQAVLVLIPVPRDSKAGRHTYKITVTAGKETQSAELDVHVSSVRIPDAGEKSVYLTNWFSMENFCKDYNAGYWTPKFWKAVAEQAAMMYHARQNTFIIPLGIFLNYSDGVYSLSEKNLIKFIRTFTDAGLYWIEGGHFGSRDGGWEAKDFVVVHSHHSVKSIEGNRDIAQIAKLLRNFMDKYGLKKRWIQHVTDEPIICNSDSYRIFAGLIRKYMPGIPLLDAMSDPEIAGAPDIWCPQVQEYQRNRDLFEAAREQGDHIWTYTCCCPGGPWLNRLCDEQLVRPLLLGWGCGYYGIEGFLHWGWNYYLDYPKLGRRQDPFEETSPHEFFSSTNILPPGDTHIVYPGKDGHVWSSMRLEAQREGMEDWELIRMLQRKNPEKCREIISSVFRSFEDYTMNPQKIRTARTALLTALEKK